MRVIDYLCEAGYDEEIKNCEQIRSEIISFEAEGICPAKRNISIEQIFLEWPGYLEAPTTDGLPLSKGVRPGPTAGLVAGWLRDEWEEVLSQQASTLDQN